MKLKIRASSFFTSRYLEVDSAGIKFCETAFVGGVKRFKFNDIDFILMSDKDELSFQVKQEIFTIPIKPDKDKHKEVISVLLQEVRRANAIGTV
jgi:hypothetical protein